MNPNDHSDESLDRLLREATWPEPAAEQTSRLRGQWFVLRRAQRRRAIGTAVAMAAGLLVATAAAVWQSGQHVAGPRVVAARANRPQRPIEPSTMPVESARAAPQAVPETVTGVAPVIATPTEPLVTVAAREPNAYEQVVLIGQSRGAKNASKRVTRRQRQTAIGQLVQEFAAEPDAVGDEALAQRLAQINDWEALLAEEARRGSATIRLAIARMLADVGTVKSIPLLNEFSANLALHATAVAGLARLASASDVAQLALREPDARLREELLASLAVRGTEEAVGLYLQFVEQPTFRAGALDALVRVDHPPTNLLLAYLGAPQLATRRAAAQALGRLTDPEIAQRLAAILGDGNRRQEALVALLLNTSPQAEALVRAARQNLYLVASLQAAELERDSLIHDFSTLVDGSQTP